MTLTDSGTRKLSPYRGTFSLSYSIGDGDCHVIDWKWRGNKGWVRSVKEYTSSTWEEEGELNQVAYEALLKHFGLEERAAKFPIDKIATMSPKKLARIGGKDPQSSTVGDNRRASQVS